MPTNTHRVSNREPSPRSHCFAGHLATEGSSPAPTGEQIAAGLNTSLPLYLVEADGFICSGTEPSCNDAEQGLIGVMVGEARWTSTELQQIADEQGQGNALLRAYRLHGDLLTDRVRGAFGFALFDLASDRALLGVDRMGRVPLYYSMGKDSLRFGTSARSLLAMKGAPVSIGPQGLYDYFYFHMVPAPTPVFEGMERLQAGCTAHYRRGHIEVRRYWQPRFSERAKTPRRDSYAELRNHLLQAVAASLPNSGKVGAFLSGGLDSSTVTGMLAELSDGPCDVYSIGFAAEGYDEMEYARITASHFEANLHEYYVTPEDVVEALPLIASAYDEPFGNSSALPAYFCAKLAADDGVSLLLAGDGGDEIFAGNERYAKQKTFEAYRYLPGLLKKVLLEPLVASAPSWVPFSEKARSYLKQANTPLPDRLQAYNFLHRHAAAEVFQQEFLAQVDTEYPRQLQREMYRVPERASTLNRMLFLDWQFTLADNDLRKINQTCALAGVDVSFPMLDDELVEFSTRIPSDWKLPARRLRDFYKKALTGWLPDATIAKSKQGFGLPFGLWMRTHRPLQEIAYDNIVALRSRGIFNPEFLDNAVRMHREGHAVYFGELIWVLCVLELWLTSHMRNPARL